MGQYSCFTRSTPSNQDEDEDKHEDEDALDRGFDSDISTSAILSYLSKVSSPTKKQFDSSTDIMVRRRGRAMSDGSSRTVERYGHGRTIMVCGRTTRARAIAKFDKTSTREQRGEEKRARKNLRSATIPTPDPDPQTRVYARIVWGY